MYTEKQSDFKSTEHTYTKATKLHNVLEFTWLYALGNVYFMHNQ